MCLLMDDDDGSGAPGGNPKLQLKRSHTWLIPRRVLTVILGVSIIFIIMGILLMAIGGGIGSAALHIVGGLLFGFGIIGLIICVFVCLYAYFYYGTRDQAAQTDMTWAEDFTDTPGYASIGRPSALKSADSTLRRNGTAGQKKVTMAPEVGPYGESPPNAVHGGHVMMVSQPGMQKSPSLGSGTVFVEGGPDPRGPAARSIGSLDVGTGGIGVVPAERPFPSPVGQAGYASGSESGRAYAGSGGGQFAYGAGSSHVIYSGGGGSSASSSVIDPTYAYPKSVSVISGPESGYSESGSQYSTLRSIPVTHIVADSQRQQQQQQQQETVEYARVNKQAKTAQVMNVDYPSQRGFVVQGQPGQFQSGTLQSGQSHSGTLQSGQFHSGTLQSGQSQSGTLQSGQFQQRSYSAADDFDYDNPVERTPMIPPKQGQGSSYHEQQMQYQRQQRQQDLYAPRQLDTRSLQRQTASNPYHYQHQQQQHQQQQQQQQMQYQSSHSTSRQVTSDDLPEPQPLVYPSARRPMTFEQVSSSKMSVYDNVLAGLKDGDEE